GALKLRMAIPAQTAPAQIWVNETKLAELGATNGFQDFSFPTTRGEIGLSGDVLIKIVSNTFTAPPDTRALGVQVDDAQFSGGGAPVLPPTRVLFFLPLLTLLSFVIGAAWSGTRIGGWIAAGVILFVCALGLFNARLTNVLPAPALSDNSLRVLFLAMSAAFAFRLWFAHEPGYIVDTQDYVVWSYKTVTYGLGSSSMVCGFPTNRRG
ncbi:MAG: hypothetical protein DCC52_17760, partial [Chloroflexi bacterium]